MTHTNEKSDQDRGLWEQYRRTWPDSLRADIGPDPDGEDANQIAAFLYDRPTRREKSAIEKRMAHEPAFREAVLAAQAAAIDEDTAPETAPAELLSFAHNLKPLHDSSGRAPTRMPVERKGGFFLKPVSGFAFGMALLGIVAGYGIFKAVEGDTPQGPVAGKTPPAKSPARTAKSGKLDPDKNSIFSADPELIFDGLDVDPE